MARVRDTRDEFANMAWQRCMWDMRSAFDEVRTTAALDADNDSAQPGARRRRMNRLALAVLKALIMLFWEMLCAVSFPVLIMLIHIVMRLLVYAVMAYVIYKMLTVW